MAVAADDVVYVVVAASSLPDPGLSPKCCLAVPNCWFCGVSGDDDDDVDNNVDFGPVNLLTF